MSNHLSTRTLAVFFVTLFFCSNLNAQSFGGIHTSNSLVIGPCGDTVLLRGINYAPYSWGYDTAQLLLSEVAQTGANAVRMTWYTQVPGKPYYTDQWLDTAIATCIRNKMIPIIELHDNTCMNDYDSLIKLASWYISPGRLNIINKYSNSLIIDIANEAGYVNWDGNPAQAQQSYQNAYDSIVHMLRSAGVNVPLMIDAPDCGTSIDVFSNVANNLINSDPQHNLIFSAHAYWYAYASNDSATMRQKISTAQGYNFPLVLAEIADYQDDATACQYTLNYPALLHICQELNVGWLAWCWYEDVCTQRQLSNDGNFANLSVYGSDLVNNSGYGLHNTAVLESYLGNNQACITTAVNQLSGNSLAYRIYTENGVSYIQSLARDVLYIHAYDITGRLIMQTTLQPGQTTLLTVTLTSAMGVVQVFDGTNSFMSKYLNP